MSQVVTIRSSRSRRAASDYLALVEAFPLRPIQTASDHTTAMKLISKLTSLGDERLTDGQADYLAALSHFVADYEAHALSAALPKATPCDTLRHLMDSRAMTSAQFGDAIGSRSAASMILRGRREMSKAHIIAAAALFGVSPAVFL